MDEIVIGLSAQGEVCKAAALLANDSAAASGGVSNFVARDTCVPRSPVDVPVELRAPEHAPNGSDHGCVEHVFGRPSV